MQGLLQAHPREAVELPQRGTAIDIEHGPYSDSCSLSVYGRMSRPTIPVIRREYVGRSVEDSVVGFPTGKIPTYPPELAGRPRQVLEGCSLTFHVLFRPASQSRDPYPPLSTVS